MRSLALNGTRSLICGLGTGGQGWVSPSVSARCPSRPGEWPPIERQTEQITSQLTIGDQPRGLTPPPFQRCLKDEGYVGIVNLRTMVVEQPMSTAAEREKKSALLGFDFISTTAWAAALVGGGGEGGL